MTEQQEIARLRAGTINLILSIPDDASGKFDYDAADIHLLHDAAVLFAVTGAKELPLRVINALKTAVAFYRRAFDARVAVTGQQPTINHANLSEHVAGLFELNQADSDLLALHILQLAKEQLNRKKITAQTAEQAMSK